MNKNILINQIINIMQSKNKSLIQQFYNIIYDYFQKCLQEERNKISTIRVPPNGTIVIFDKEDEDKVLPYSWYESSNGYITRAASTYERRNNNIPITIGLHRWLLNLNKTNKINVDHINHCKNDNRKSNLRLATTSQNGMNQLLTSQNTSGIKGIRRKHEKHKLKNGTILEYDYWIATVTLNTEEYSKIFPYTDKSLQQAKLWRQQKCKELHKEFALYDEELYKLNNSRKELDLIIEKTK